VRAQPPSAVDRRTVFTIIVINRCCHRIRFSASRAHQKEYFCFLRHPSSLAFFRYVSRTTINGDTTTMGARMLLLLPLLYARTFCSTVNRYRTRLVHARAPRTEKKNKYKKTNDDKSTQQHGKSSVKTNNGHQTLDVGKQVSVHSSTCLLSSRHSTRRHSSARARRRSARARVVFLIIVRSNVLLHNELFYFQKTRVQRTHFIIAVVEIVWSRRDSGEENNTIIVAVTGLGVRGLVFIIYLFFFFFFLFTSFCLPFYSLRARVRRSVRRPTAGTRSMILKRARERHSTSCTSSVLCPPAVVIWCKVDFKFYQGTEVGPSHA
jgi:hypothetical protein